jgi:hypothetical protein
MYIGRTCPSGRLQLQIPAGADPYEDEMPKEIAAVLYFAAIVVALRRCGARITRLSDGELRAGVEWVLAQPWIDPATRALFAEVFSAPDSRTAAETINRVIDFFPPHQHQQARPHDPDRLVAERRRIVARAQRPVQGGGQDAGDRVVVLRCGYEHGVVGTYLLPKLFHGLGVPLILEILVKVRYPGEIEVFATHPLRSHLVRRPHDATVEGGPPEAAGEAEYAEIFMLHCLHPDSLLDSDR